MSTAFIIGNGPTRKEIDLNTLVVKGVIYGCNALYRDFDKFDYLVVIDEQFRKLIEAGGKEGVVEGTKLILPPDEECIEETTGRRGNAGMNAMKEAIKRGATKLFCLGFDFIHTDVEINTGNIYKDTEGYGEDTRATFEDSRYRVNYLNWLMKNNPEVRFTFVVPDQSNLFNIGLDIDNAYFILINNFIKHYGQGEEVVVEETKEAS